MKNKVRDDAVCEKKKSGIVMKGRNDWGMMKKVMIVLLLALVLVLGAVQVAFAAEEDGDIARQFVSDSPTDGMYCSVSSNTLRHYDSYQDDPYFANGGFMFGTTVGKMKAYVICVDFEDCVGAERVEYGDLQNVFWTEGMEYDYSKPETYYKTIFMGSDSFGEDFTGEQEYVGMVEYFNQVSYGMMDMEVEFINAMVPNEDGSWPWFRLPGEQRDWAIQYASEVEDYRIFGRLYEGALEVAYEQVPDLNIDDISFLYVVTPVNTFGFRSGLQGGAGIDTAFSYQDQAIILRDTELRHEPLLTTENGVVIGSGTTITKGARGYDGADRSYFRVMAHETGHGLGLIDDYTYSGTDHLSANSRSWSSPVGNWGIMGGMTADVPDWPVWYKFKAGWIEDDEIEVVMPGETKEIVISALGSKEGAYDQGAKMVLIPTEWRTVDTFNNPTWNPNGTDYNFLDWFTPVWLGGEEFAMKSFPTGYVLESRRAVGADYLNTSGTPGTQGVLITQLSNLTWETGHGAAGLKVMRNPGVNVNRACIGVDEYAGENGAYSWEDVSRGVKIEVLESNLFYDRVRITYTGEGEGVDEQGAPVTVERDYQGELTLSDTYAMAGDTITVDFDLFTLGESADNGNMLTPQAPDPVIVGAGSPLGVPGGVAGYTLTVSFDPAVLRYVADSQVSAIDGLDVIDNGDGTLTVTATGDTMIRDWLLSLDFQVLDGVDPDTYSIDAEITDVELLTFTGEAADIDGVDVAVFGGAVTVTDVPTYSVSGLITESKHGDVGVPAEISLYDENGDLVAETKSGTYGAYVIEGVPAGEGYYLVASKHLYDDTESAPFAVIDQDVDDVDVELQLTLLTISGHVYGDSEDNPLAGAKVQLVDGGFLPVGEPVYTDRNGYYEIHDATVMENDFYTLTAFADGYGNNYGAHYGIGKQDLFSATDDLEDVDITLSSTYMINGTITPADGAANYRVQLYQNGEPVGDPVAADVIVTEGWWGPTTSIEYTISGVPSGAGYTVEISGDGYLTRTTTPFKVMTTNVLRKNLSLTPLADAVAVSGTVTNDNGRPVEGVTVTSPDTVLGHVVEPVVTDANGAYTVYLPKHAEYQLRFMDGQRYANTSRTVTTQEEAAITLNVTLSDRSETSTTASDRYVIQAQAGEGGQIAPSGKVSVTEGTDKTFTITADAGYVVKDVVVNGRSVGVVTTYTFKDVDADATIEVLFVQEGETDVVNPFVDVKTTDWFYQDVLTAWKDGLVNGRTTTTYVPDGNITLAEAIKLAATMHQKYTTGNVTLANGSPEWYSTYVAYAVANGIIQDGEYTDLNAIATRAQFASIFAAALPDDALKAIHTIEDGKIPDVKLSDSYGAAVYKLYQAGVLTGNDEAGTFAPMTNIKRSEVAAIVNRMMHAENRITDSL